MEIYKFVELTDKKYIITSLWRVISMNYNDWWYWKELKQQTRWKWYKFVLIDWEPISIHRLVWNHFILNPEKKPYINHINWVKDDNRIENLEWVTGKENCQHAHDTWLNPVTANNTYLSNHPDKWKFYWDSKSSKAVLVYSLDWKFLCEYSSCREASEKTGAHKSWISQCCSWQVKSAKWYFFKFKL